MESKEVYDDDGGIRGVDNDMYDTDMGYINNTLQCNVLVFHDFMKFFKIDLGNLI